MYLPNWRIYTPDLIKCTLSRYAYCVLRNAKIKLYVVNKRYFNVGTDFVFISCTTLNQFTHTHKASIKKPVLADTLTIFNNFQLFLDADQKGPPPVWGHVRKYRKCFFIDAFPKTINLFSLKLFNVRMHACSAAGTTQQI